MKSEELPVCNGVVLIGSFTDTLQYVGDVRCRYGGSYRVGWFNYDSLFQFGLLLTIDYHFTRRHLRDTYLWRWWYDDTARWERDGMDSFDCLP